MPQESFRRPKRLTGRPGQFLARVKIRNYKSIDKCDVFLNRLTILVGRNSAGKSNFLDAIRFVVDGLQTSLDNAIRNRGGIDVVRRKSTGHPRNFAIELAFFVGDDRAATYGFEIAARQRGGFAVGHERLRLFSPGSGDEIAGYSVSNGKVTQSSVPSLPQSLPDRLLLVTASGLAEFGGVYQALLSMGFYNLNPEAMKELQSPDAGELLHRDGANIASVVARLSEDAPDVSQRISQYLDSIVPGILGVNRVALGPKESLEFRQEVKGSENPWRFYANSMSDGTLRALGSLVAVMQFSRRDRPVRFVGIEEPETALHPAASGSLLDALREASRSTQVAVTTHSHELLDHLDLAEEGLLVVESNKGTTEVAPVDESGRKAIRKHLYTAGELLRMDQLHQDEKEVDRQRQMSIFEDGIPEA